MSEIRPTGGVPYSALILVLLALVSPPDACGQSIVTIEFWSVLDGNSRGMWAAGFLDATYVRYAHEVEQGDADQRALASSMVRCLSKVTPQYFAETILRDAIRERRAWDRDTRMFVLGEAAITEWCRF